MCEVMVKPQTSEQELVNVYVASLKEVLGWDDTEIKREFPVQVGHETKRGDVMLANSVVIEAKRQGVSFNDMHILQQLKSYMRVKYKKFGCLLGSELWFFYDDYSDTREDLKIIGKFDFTDKDNPVANDLAMILTKMEFSIDKLTEFCKKNWSGEYMESLTNCALASKTRNVGTKKEKPRESSEFWTRYWLDFKRKYQRCDDDEILAHMELGSHNDLYINERTFKQLFNRTDGVQFGLARGNRPNMRKVEVRVGNVQTWQKYFESNLVGIIQRIETLGGTYAPKNPDNVINCYFPVTDDTKVSHERIFEMYCEFKDIILDYLERR